MKTKHCENDRFYGDGGGGSKRKWGGKKVKNHIITGERCGEGRRERSDLIKASLEMKRRQNFMIIKVKGNGSKVRFIIRFKTKEHIKAHL